MADANLNEIAKLLSILEKNYTSVANSFYTIFYDPVAKEEVEIKIYDDKDIEIKKPDGSTLTIPNRAYDMRFLQNGEGSPEGVITGKGRGTVYLDTLNGSMYVKTTPAALSTGWSLLLDRAQLNDVIRRGSVSPEGVVAANKGALYIEAGTTVGSDVVLYIKTTDSGNTGWLEFTTTGFVRTDNTAQIRGWSMPDYSAGVSISTWDTAILATTDGYIRVSANTNSSEYTQYNIFISTDGTTFTDISNLYTATAAGHGAAIVPIPKGIYYKIHANKDGVAIFYPCKGEV